MTPPAWHGKPQANPIDGYVDGDQYVFVTPDREIAEAFAWAASGSGRPRVCTVVPLDPVEPDLATVNGQDGLLFRIRGWASVVAVDVLAECPEIVVGG